MIIPISSMTNQNQAGLIGTKSHFYGISEYDNMKMKEELIRKALELDPDYEEWMFILAKLLRSKRRLEHFKDLSEIPKEELSLLEKVVAKTNKCEHLIYLAQAYRESEKMIRWFYKHKEGFLSSELFQSLKDMAKDALKYYILSSSGLPLSVRVDTLATVTGGDELETLNTCELANSCYITCWSFRLI
ncbi:hypothetical protein J6590_001019 [Homalodisca vitripennis]|nr:hypothetical protein J6590_001019 [Homalodisca vitripennis]